MHLIDSLAIDAHKHDDDTQVAMAYDSGIGQGYIGFSESTRLLKNRADRIRIKAISRICADCTWTPRLSTPMSKGSS